MQFAVTKREFLVVYDYGMGGLWGVMSAETAEQVRARYPELVIADRRPAWMTEDKLEQLRATEFHDIDAEPWGILDALLADRRREGD